MRTLVRMVTLVVALLPASLVLAAPTDLDQKVKDYLGRNQPEAKKTGSWFVLTLDHKTQEWKAWKATSNTDTNGWNVHKPLTSGIEMQLNNIPRLQLSKNDKLTVLVFNTNSLIYSINRKETSVVPSDDAAQLQEIADLISNVLQTTPIFKSSGTERSAERDTKATLPAVDPRFVAAIKKIDEAKTQQASDSDKAIKAYEKSLEVLRDNVNNIDAAKWDLFVRVQKMELGTSNALNGLTEQKLMDNLQAAFSSMWQLRKRLLEPSPDCRFKFETMLKATDLLLESEDGQFTEGQRVGLEVAKAGLRKTDGCEGSEAAAKGLFVGLIEDSLNAKTPEKRRNRTDRSTGSSKKQSEEEISWNRPWKEIRFALSKYTETLEGLATMRKEAAAKSEELYGKQDSTLKAAAVIDAAISSAVQCFKESPSECTVLDATDSVIKPTWSKIEKHKFDIKATGWRAADFEKRRSELTDVSYEVIGGGNWGFSLGFGLIGTKAVNPTWEAVQNPQNKDEKVIARTEETSLAGKPTLLVTIHPWGLKEVKSSPGLEIGAGMDKTNPSIFIGPSIGFGRWVRLGLGEGFFLVDSLAKGQKAMAYRNGALDPDSLTKVSKSEDIRTRRRILGMPYVSLTITIDSLSFFKPKDE